MAEYPNNSHSAREENGFYRTGKAEKKLEKAGEPERPRPEEE